MYTRKALETTVNETTITKEKTLSSRLALYAGATVQSNKELGKVTPGAQVGLLLNSNTIITGGYNLEGDWSAGVKIRVFNINK